MNQTVFDAIPQNIDITPGPTGAFTDGTLIQIANSDTPVFLVLYGQSIGLPNETVAVNLFGSNWRLLVEACTGEQFNAYPLGPAFSPTACLIQPPSQQICVFSWNQWLWIINPTVQSAYNFNGSVIPVAQGLFDALSQGLDITG